MNSESNTNSDPDISSDTGIKNITHENVSTSVFQKLDNFFSRHITFFIIFALLTALLFSLLLFDVKMSTSNDDSMYVESAYDFARLQKFPAVNAPFYPMFLSIFILTAGLNIILLKGINIVFILLNILLMFLAYRKRSPLPVLLAVLFITAVNSYILYFGSQTFSEAMALTLQSLFLLSAFNIYDKVCSGISLKESAGSWLMLGLSMFLFALTRNSAILAVPVLMLFFMLNRKFSAAAFTLFAYLIFKIPFEMMRIIFWKAQDQYSGQLDILMLKDPYNSLKGKEDFAGFLTRFYQNADLYISKRLMQILGFRSPDSADVDRYLVYLFIFIFAVSLIFIFKKRNKYLQFTALYIAAFLSETFLILQTQWDQPRLILVYVPLILLVIFSGFYYLTENKSRVIQVAFITTILIFFAAGIIPTVIKSKDNLPVLEKNISGDIYYGYNPDWVNYLRLSEWCADSLPQNSFVAVRKAPMSFIYSRGKKFYPVYNVFSSDPDSVLTVFRENKVTHVIAASLRSNPKLNNGSIINTMQRLMYPVSQKYPDKIKLIKTMGESEPAYLFEIIY